MVSQSLTLSSQTLFPQLIHSNSFEGKHFVPKGLQTAFLIYSELLCFSRVDFEKGLLKAGIQIHYIKPLFACFSF